MPRFFINTPLSISESIDLPTDVVRHLHVLRLQNNDMIELFNGNGNKYLAKVSELNKKTAIANIMQQLKETELPKLRIKLAMCIIANDKMDLVIQKATELGVYEIIPILSGRTQRLDKNKYIKKLEHWQNIIISSCEQCGSDVLPIIQPVLDFDDILQQTKDIEHKIILSTVKVNQDKLSAIKPSPDEILLLIGPEGGFIDNEISKAINAGFKPLTLGNLTMRAETAAIASIVVMLTQFANW